MWIESERLFIRNFSIEDLNEVFEFMSSPEMAEFEQFPAMSWDETVHYIKKFSFTALSQQDPWVELAIFQKEERRVIGGLSIKYVDKQLTQVEIGYRIHWDFQSQGYATEACRVVIDELFRIGVRRISASTAAKNVASWKVMEKLGMRREAHFREKVLIHGAYEDEYVYALLSSN